MLKKINLLILFVACFIVTLFSFTNVEAGYNANSNSGSGSFDCSENCSGGDEIIYEAKTFSDQTWKYPGIFVRLVYYDPATGQNIIAGPTKVYPYKRWVDGVLKNAYTGSVKKDDPSAFDEKSIDKWMHTEWDPPRRYIEFNAKQFQIDTVGGNKKTPEAKKAQFIKFLEKMGEIDPSWKNVKLENLTNPSCEVDMSHKGNCYGKAGYRLIAELHLAVQQTNGVGESARNNKLVPSKSLEGEVSKDSIENAKTKNEYGGMSKYMHINWSDINYKCYNQNGGAECNSGSAGSTECLFDKNCGYGVWIVDISSFLTPNYDYRLDMACSNCESTTDKSMIIQDTNDWRDITESSKVTKKICGNRYDKIKKYFKKATIDGADVFCREEYHVTYPNAKNSISILVGRYFTVNETQENLNKIDSTIPNFAPIEVERIRECRDTSDGVKLSAFDNSNSVYKKNFLECVPGKITLNYNDKTYKYTDELDANMVSSSSNINGNSLIQRVKYSYRLKQDVFRYVRVKDGYSLDKRPNDLTDNNNAGYKDLLVSNLPVSLSSNAEGNTIKFKYELPTNSTTCDTFIKEVYDKPDFLSCTSKKEHDFYKQDNPDNLKDTACAKLYNTTDLKNEGFENCVNDRVKSKNPMGNCEKLNYMCDLKFPDGKPTVCSEENCCEKGTIYASKSGKCCDPSLIVDGVCKSQPGTCNKENHKKLGRDWNENENKCCPVNYKYNVQSKKCEPPADEKCKSLGCEACCYDENNNSYCGTILNGKVICPGKPSVRNIVYRTIDTSYPFTSQNGEIRNTGKNWCSNSSTSGIKSSCSGSSENNTVSTVITDKKGLTEENAMYKIHLDSNSISEIRKYNSKNSYDDFTLECNNKGDECLSNFIRNSSYGELTGKCSGPYFGNC